MKLKKLYVNLNYVEKVTPTVYFQQFIVGSRTKETIK